MLSGTAEFKIFNDHFGKGMDKVSILTRCIIIDKSEERLGSTCYFIYRDSPLNQLYCCNAYITFLVISRYVTSLTYCEDPEVIISGSGVSIN